MTKLLFTLALFCAVCFAQAQPAKTAVAKTATPAASATMPTSAAPAEDKEKNALGVTAYISLTKDLGTTDYNVGRVHTAIHNVVLAGELREIGDVLRQVAE